MNAGIPNSEKLVKCTKQGCQGPFATSERVDAFGDHSRIFHRASIALELRDEFRLGVPHRSLHGTTTARSACRTVAKVDAKKLAKELQFPRPKFPSTVNDE